VFGGGCTVATTGVGNGADGGPGPSYTTTDGGTSPQGGSDGGTIGPLPGDGGCIPQSCSSVGATCGPIGDGCGGQLNCGECGGSDTCGGGGTPSVCGTGVTCQPTTCARAAANCGPVADGCGGVLMCGSCEAGTSCGGDGYPSLCSGTSAACQNLCLQQVTCPNSGKTTVSGVVYAPTPSTFLPSGGTADPIYNVTVYIPNAPVAAFADTVTCDQCGTPVSGNPLVITTTNAKGEFTLTNAPVGSNIPLVIQIGRWRREVVIPTVSACVDNPVSADLTRFPRTHQEGNIPHIAMVTGSADPLECVLRKIGIADAEFGDPGGTNGHRVDLYVNNGAGYDSSTPSMGTLTGNPTKLNSYDMVVFACAGQQIDQTTTAQQNVINYANAGGRVFATHYSYVWFYNISPWSGTAVWDNPIDNMNDSSGSISATVDQSFSRGVAFAQWLLNVGASTTLGNIGIEQVRNNFSAVNAPSQRWLYDSQQPLHYTFNTPVGAADGMQCGRALFSDFHVSQNGNGTGGGGITTCTNSSQCSGGTCIAGICLGGGGIGGGGMFPSECDTNPMDAQEKALEFMMFDLASCVQNGGFVIGGQ
jgi:hypothetical protein